MFTKKIDDTLSLALIQPSFAKDYFEIVSQQHQQLSEFLPWVRHAKDEAFFQTFITQSLHDYADGKSMICTIIYNNNVVGVIGINKISHELKKTNLGYWLSADYRGKGIVTRSTQAMVDYTFNDLGMTKVEIKSAVANKASRAVAERLGFTLEGIITQSERVNDVILDHAVYGLRHSDA